MIPRAVTIFSFPSPLISMVSNLLLKAISTMKGTFSLYYLIITYNILLSKEAIHIIGKYQLFTENTKHFFKK